MDSLPLTFPLEYYALRCKCLTFEIDLSNTHVCVCSQKYLPNLWLFRAQILTFKEAFEENVQIGHI